MPFQPEEGRPVFCEICLKKKGKKIPRREVEETEALAALGIEFDAKPKIRTEYKKMKPRIKPQTRPQTKTYIGKSSQSPLRPAVNMATKKQAMSLKDLKKQSFGASKKDKGGGKANVEELKRVLEKALSEKES